MPQRVVITGMGCITPLGDSAAAVRESVVQGRTAFRRSAVMPDVAESPVSSFACATYAGRWKHARYLARGAQFALAAAMRAVEDAGLSSHVVPGGERGAARAQDNIMKANSMANTSAACGLAQASPVPQPAPACMPDTAGLYLGMGPNLDFSADFPVLQAGRHANGSATGGQMSQDPDMSAAEALHRDIALLPLDHEGLPALWLLKYLPNTAASAIAQRLGLHGENATLGTACAASLMALGAAFRAIKNGYQTVALAGGGDSRLSAGAMLGYRKASALCAEENRAPEAASRPFDAARCGFVPAEGGAVFVLESLDHAVARGARILAEVHGYGNSLDGYAMTAPEPQGVFAEQAVRGALREAGMAPHDVDAVSAHGTSTLLNDAMEAQLIARVFDDSSIPFNRRKIPAVLALKSWLGHGAAACGAMELAVCLATLPHGIVPSVRNLVTPCHTLPFAGLDRFAPDESEPDESAPEKSEPDESVGAESILASDLHGVHSGTRRDIRVGTTARNAIGRNVGGGTEQPIRTVLLQNFGFGGQNAALVVTLREREA